MHRIALAVTLCLAGIGRAMGADAWNLPGEQPRVVEGKVVDKYEYESARPTLQWAADCAAKDRYKARALARAQAEEKASA